MPNNTNRFGISGLSKSNKDDAYEEEILVDKKTGEFLIKTKDKDIVSYNYLNRLNNHIEQVTATAYNMDIPGALYSVTLNNTEFPAVVDTDINILENDTITIPGKYSKFLLSLDMDCIRIEENEFSNTKYNPTIELSYKLNKTSSLSLSFTIKLSDLNRYVCKIADNTDMNELMITGITIKNIGIPTSVHTRNILNSIIIIVDN